MCSIVFLLALIGPAHVISSCVSEEHTGATVSQRSAIDPGHGSCYHSLVCFMAVREGPEDPAGPNFQIQAHAYKLIWSRKSIFHAHVHVCVAEKITCINIIHQ